MIMSKMWLTIVACFSLVIVDGAAIRPATRSLRGTSTASSTTTPPPVLEELVCRVLWTDTDYMGGDDPDDPEDEYSCIPIGSTEDDNSTDHELLYDFPLPTWFLQEQDKSFLQSGLALVVVFGGRLEGDAVHIPDGAALEAIGVTNADNSDSLPLQFRSFSATPPVTGVRSVLMVRVVATDASPTVSAERLGQLTFTTDSDNDNNNEDDAPAITFQSQYNDCSFGQLQMEPTPDDATHGIAGGVMDIAVDIPAAGTTRQTMTRAAVQALRTKLGVRNLSHRFDHVLLCHPPGTDNNGSWLAYSFLNYHISVYNDEWCSYVSATVHEVGHNIGLTHSNENGALYGDQTGYMGFSYPAVGEPAMCFNGHKHWQLGWYQQHSATVEFIDNGDDNDDDSNVWVGNVAAFVDADLIGSDGDNNSNDHVVLVRVGDLYVQYNRAKKFNHQTGELPDHLTIVQAYTDGTQLLKGLRQPGSGDDTTTSSSSVFVYSNFTQDTAAKDLTIRVCDTVTHSDDDNDNDDDNSIDYMRISIGLNNDAPCATIAGSPSSFPTESPFPSPSPSSTPKNPSSFPTESPFPSPSPSSTPTIGPPSPLTASPYPSPSPSTTPSIQLPSAQPTGSPAPSPPPSISARPSHSTNPTDSPMPSPAPTAPSASPMPSSIPTISDCQDTDNGDTPTFVVPVKALFENLDNDGTFASQCRWLADNPEFQPFLCIDGLEPYTVCPRTCNNCGR